MRSFLHSLETWVVLVLLLVSVGFYVSALSLPEGSFDPLGPGAAPEMVSLTLIVLCTIVLIRSLLRHQSGDRRNEDGPIDIIERTAEPTPKSFILFLILLFLYLMAFQLQLAHFIVVTSIFVFLAILSLHGWTPRTAIISAILGLGLSTSLFFILTKFFVIRLPGAF